MLGACSHATHCHDLLQLRIPFRLDVLRVDVLEKLHGLGVGFPVVAEAQPLAQLPVVE